MSNNYIEAMTFTKKDFSKDPLRKGEYENYSLIDCDLSNSGVGGLLEKYGIEIE